MAELRGGGMSLMKRSKVYHLRKRVPVQYRSVETRQTVYISLQTDSESVASQKAAAIWREQIELWEARLAGDTQDAELRYATAQRIATTRGFRYLTAPDVAQLPRHKLLERIEDIPLRANAPDDAVARAVLGAATEPPITISRALELYWRLAQDKTRGKSDDQIRRWKNPRRKAIGNLIDVIGDKPMSEITGDDMLDFRQWWFERMQARNLTANSANKDLIHLGDILKTVNRMKRLNLTLPLSDLAFKEGEARQRPAFSRGWIARHLLSPGALDGLNADARGILLCMINTGARPSELAALTRNEIILDVEVPHISIAAIDRQIKSANARRVIPLLGVSLDALQASPDGFSRYRGSSAGVSDTVNKYLRANNLLETPEHTMYGLRHGFEDRMLAEGIDERIRRDIMGHALQRERYGKGASLEMARDLLEPVSL